MENNVSIIDEKGLVSFGNFLLSHERKKAVVHSSNQVHDGDLSKWRESEEGQATAARLMEYLEESRRFKKMVEIVKAEK